MSRYTPTNFGGDLAPLNPEFEKIAQAIMDTLSRKGDTPNSMEADLDMNSQRILNLPAPRTAGEPARLKDVQDATGGIPEQEGNAGRYLKTNGSVATWELAVDSFKGRTGNVQPQASDYDASQIDSTNGNVQLDLDLLDSRLTTAESKISSNDTDISNLQSVDLQQKTLEKLKRNAVFYADFTKDEAIVASDLSKTAQSVASAITYTAPDGQTGITADGRIATAGVDEPAIVYRDGKCQGLQVVPSSTNLWLQSENLDTTSYSSSTEISFSNSSEQSPIVGGSTPQSVNSSATSSTGFIYQTSSVTAGNVYSITTILKPTGISLSDITTAFYDNTDGAFITQDAAQTITALRDGFYMISASVTAPTGCVSMRGYIHRGSIIVGESFVHAGSQFEQGYPTPHIPTTTSQVTRGVSAANSAIVYNIPARWGVYHEFEIIEEISTDVFSLYKDANNYFAFVSSSSGDWTALIRTAGASNSFGTNTPITQKRNKAFVYNDGQDIFIFINGSLVHTEIDAGIYFNNQDSVILALGSRDLNGANRKTTTSRSACITYSQTSQAEAIALTTLEE